jgi:hypothetical protein
VKRFDVEGAQLLLPALAIVATRETLRRFRAEAAKLLGIEN